MLDKRFSEVFEENMRLLRLPLPTAKSWYETLEAALGMTAALSALVKLGDKPINQIFAQAGMVGAAGAGGAAAGDLLVSVGGMLGSVYVGLLAGCLLEAAAEVYGVKAVGEAATLLRLLRADLGRAYDSLLREAVACYPLARRLGLRAMYLIRLAAP